MTYILTAEQAENIITAASIRDVLNSNVGLALAGHLRDQHVDQWAEAEKNVPEDILRAANVAMANRPEGTPRSRAAYAWIRAQNVTD